MAIRSVKSVTQTRLYDLIMNAVSQCLNTAPAGAAMIVVYEHYVTVNRRAMELLGITCNTPYISFSLSGGHVSVAGTSSPSGHRVYMRAYCGRISSTALAHWLGRNLQGPGTYRLQEEYQVHNPTGEQKPCYEMFFRKYQNQRNYDDKTQTAAAPHLADEP